jgi:hypothetical protein
MSEQTPAVPTDGTECYICGRPRREHIGPGNRDCPTQPAVPTDAAVIAAVRRIDDAKRLAEMRQVADSKWDILTHTEVYELLSIAERQRLLLDECATVLAHDYESESPELCPGWDELDYEDRGGFMARAALSLLEEIRR